MGKTNYPVKQIAKGCYAVDEFGLDMMYVVIGEERALVIDTGSGAGDFKGLIEEMTSLPYDVVATHGHGDHVGGAGQFQEIFIHPKDFEAKDKIEDLIDEYNTEQKAAGHEEYVISYTDMVAVLMSSVTSIINIITYEIGRAHV